MAKAMVLWKKRIKRTSMDFQVISNYTKKLAEVIIIFKKGSTRLATKSNMNYCRKYLYAESLKRNCQNLCGSSLVHGFEK